ncbi:uncharacterized protein BCR38DRAFT_455553 [Pseudomassariella vexata]|uniref:Uncharacterized protein n=1 Tax=Pseudomassariella vexata TaxID=1141098 RepID=A0A1Y2EAN3_9PEZI|nr:uncharacterized protein BCR38DRAFT_455553 [Pseudomassariella vexata]ORY68633.1 hypothetical protein BCR38DRAFT_455553 [Pseudomassariella vexata]
MSSLNDQVVLLTGAGSGIGRATALKLHELGAKLAITDINLDGAMETCKMCGSKPHYCGLLDVSNSKEVEKRVAEIAAIFGHIDHVFNCAGVNPTVMALTKTTEQYFDKLVDVNLKGMYNVTKATMPHLKHPGGSYVNVSSISGWRASSGTAIYCATKFAVIGFSKSMALELGPKGIRVNIVAPGYIDTPTNAGIAKGSPEARKAMEHGTALGRIGKAEEVADVVAFLMSNEARYMNGSVVEIDGMLKS